MLPHFKHCSVERPLRAELIHLHTSSCIHPVHMSPALNGSSVLQHFELCKIHKGIMFNFYPRLPVADNFEMKWWQIALLVIVALAMVPGIMLIIIVIVVYCRRKMSYMLGCQCQQYNTIHGLHALIWLMCAHAQNMQKAFTEHPYFDLYPAWYLGSNIDD